MTRRLHVAFLAPSRRHVDESGARGRMRATATTAPPLSVRGTRRDTTARSCSTPTATASRRCTRAGVRGGEHRPPIDASRRRRRRPSASTTRSPPTPACARGRTPRRGCSFEGTPARSRSWRARPPSTCTSPSPRWTTPPSMPTGRPRSRLPRQRPSRRAARVPPRLLRRVRLRSRRQQHRTGQPQPAVGGRSGRRPDVAVGRRRAARPDGLTLGRAGPPPRPRRARPRGTMAGSPHAKDRCRRAPGASGPPSPPGPRAPGG